MWIVGRFNHIFPQDLYAYLTGVKDVHVEIVDARKVSFQHADFKPIVSPQDAAKAHDICTVDRNHFGVSFIDGEDVETLPPGEYAFWRGVAASKVVEVDLREQAIDITGQEIMTADKVTLRMNAVVTYGIVDARQAVAVRTSTDSHLSPLTRSTFWTGELSAARSQRSSYPHLPADWHGTHRSFTPPAY